MADHDKPTARKLAFAARKAARAKGGDPAANAHLLAFLSILPGYKTIAAYMPIQTEISPVEAMQSLHESGKIICVPVIIAAGQPLKFSRWTPDTKMTRGPFGAAIPEHEDFVTPDILITPLVAFDKRGYRLGYGGGFYDRTFALLRQNKPALAIGFAFSGQEMPSVPTEPTDIRLDHMVTEHRVLSF